MVDLSSLYPLSTTVYDLKHKGTTLDHNGIRPLGVKARPSYPKSYRLSERSYRYAQEVNRTVRISVEVYCASVVSLQHSRWKKYRKDLKKKKLIL